MVVSVESTRRPQLVAATEYRGQNWEIKSASSSAEAKKRAVIEKTESVYGDPPPPLTGAGAVPTSGPV